MAKNRVLLSRGLGWGLERSKALGDQQTGGGFPTATAP